MARFITRSALIIIASLASLAVVREADAQVVVVRGVELQLPASWAYKDTPKYTTLAPKTSKGRAIQVISLPAMPAAQPGEIPVGADGKLVIPKVKEVDRDGVKILVASGKLVGKKSEVTVDLLAIPIGGKAVMLMSYVGADQDPLIREANTKILLSARIPGPRMSVKFEPTKKQGGMSKELVQDIATLTGALDKRYRLPRPLPVFIRDCGTPNAHYMGAKHEIELCHELFEYFVGVFTAAGLPADKIADHARHAYVFTFAHEFGHALVGEFGLPITGRGEDAADEIATLLLKGPAGQKASLAAARWFEFSGRDPKSRTNFWDTHSFDSQRFVNIVCLLYGSDTNTYGPLMKAIKATPERMAKCPRDYPKRKLAWDGMLAPYLVKAGKK